MKKGVKRDLFKFGLLSAIAVSCGVIITAVAPASKEAEAEFVPYETVDANGQKIYVRRDCHPTLPEIGVDGREASVIKKEVELSSIDDEDWEIGTASAYGGSGDDDTPNNHITATMEPVNENTYGVAVPMVWNTKENLGKTILIRYNGKVIEGIINDVGGMGNGTRSLDLQPGIFHEFGATDCNDWGLRTVEYKILD